LNVTGRDEEEALARRNWKEAEHQGLKESEERAKIPDQIILSAHD
jgi:hypothetical protein